MNTILITESTKVKVHLAVPVMKAGLKDALVRRLTQLDIDVEVGDAEAAADDATAIDLREYVFTPQTSVPELVEFVIRKIPFNFHELPLLTEGESKVIRLLTDKIVVEAFKPTVYSFTHNRYGIVEGTEEVRIQFTAEIFRQMNRHKDENGNSLGNAFLAVVESPDGSLLVQEKVDACNLEVRVKRFHIGSPVHRYRYTEQYASAQQDESPIRKWSRFDKPIVCFDWRNPLTDDAGVRLADEPISDDYASVWIQDVDSAKKLARNTFLWMEKLFREANLLLIDICFFIDRPGKKVFGEISPDCMRVRFLDGDPNTAESFDKDIWRNGEKEMLLLDRYKKLHELLFNQSLKIHENGKKNS